MTLATARYFNESVNMQAIQHQLDMKLFEQILPFFKEMKALKNPTSKQIQPFADKVAKTTKSVLNMTINFEVKMDDAMAAYMHVPMLGKNHTLLNLDRRRHMTNTDLREELAKTLKDTEGSISAETGRVTGFLADIPIKIVIAKEYLDTDSILSAEEACAVYLHELGHAWTYFYMLSSTIRTNVVIHAAMYEYEFGKNSQADADRLYTLEGVTGMSIPDKKSVAAKGNEAVVISILNEQVKLQRSEFGTTGFDNSGAEAIADQFVARQGAGVYIVTGLDKLQNRSKRMSATVKLLMSVLFMIGTIKLYGAPLLISLLLIDPTAGDYDDPYKRAKRVREQIVSSLRNKDMTREERRKRLGELEVIDGVMDTIKENEPLLDFIWRNVIEGGSSRVKEKIRQEQLESLINNDAYVLGSVLETNIK